MHVSRSVVSSFVAGLLLGGLGMRTFFFPKETGGASQGAVGTSPWAGAPGERRASIAPLEGAMASPAADPEGAKFRATIRKSIAAALAEGRRGQEVDAYLDELEATARKQGRVTALEILPGLAVIDRAYPEDMERSAAFSRRMERLARELEPGAHAQPTTAVAPEAMVMAVAKTPAGPARDKLVREALSALDKLPVDQQPEAFAALSRATGAAASPPPSVDFDRLLGDVRAARGAEERRALVRSFMAAANHLPLEEQDRRFQQLEAATAER